jgi:hypothetical protein
MWCQILAYTPHNMGFKAFRPLITYSIIISLGSHRVKLCKVTYKPTTCNKLQISFLARLSLITIKWLKMRMNLVILSSHNHILKGNLNPIKSNSNRFNNTSKQTMPRINLESLKNLRALHRGRQIILLVALILLRKINMISLTN